MKLGVLH